MRPLSLTELDARAERLRDRILGPDVDPPTPFWLWAQHLDLAEFVEPLGDYCRNRTTLPEGVWELCVLIAARKNRSPFAWYAHYDDAIEGGISRESLDRLAAGEAPKFASADADLAYRVVNALLTEHDLSDELFAEVTEKFGTRGLLDLIGCCGSFSMSAWVLNAFRVPAPDDRPWPFTDTEEPTGH